MVSQPKTPLRPRLLLAMALLRPAVAEHPLGCRAPIDERPGLVRIAQHLMEAMPARQAPADVPPQGPRAPLRPRPLRITMVK
jgi:hypothetical protein